MSDADERNSSGRKPLSLGGKSSGTVQQSFARGRQKSVVVEKKRKRAGAAPDKESEQAAAPVSDKDKARAALAAKAKQLGLSEEELKRRQAAIMRAKSEAEAREQKKREEEAERKRREEQERQALEEQRQREEEERRRQEEEARRAAQEAEAERRETEKPAAKAKGETRDEDRVDPATAPPDPDAKPGRKADKGRDKKDDEPRNLLEEMGGRVKSKKSGGEDKPAASRAKEPKRRQGKLTIQNLVEDDEDRQRSLASMKRARERERMRRERQAGGREKVSREVVVPEAITVQDLAQRMTERVADVVKFMMKQGQMVRATDTLEADDAELIVEEFGHTVKRVADSDVEEGFISEDDPEDTKAPRPPVVTVMGHVDHGKTSLLDALRQTDVAAGEAGGITQHIGAYQVQLKTGDKITFLDTPGHAAFSSMRSRGTQATDLVILVVAADDGVMPQTIEAISHAKAAEVPNKVLQELLQHEVFVEDMGGDVQSVPVSALKKDGLDELTEAVTLQAELLELKANPDRSAEGVVIESQIDKGRGPVATALVKRGTLKRGDIVVAGAQWGKVRALVNERGQTLKEAGPSMPAEILGLDGAPEPGEVFAVVENEARARELVEYRERKQRDKAAAARTGGASLEQMMAKLKTNEVAELPILVKADVQGSAEAIVGALEKAGNDEVAARIIHSAAGGVSESDVLLAQASDAPVFAFNVRANKQARDLAEREGVEIRYYSVIYDLIDDVKATLQGMLAPEKRESFIGYAEILEVFNITRVGKVAGCRVTEGVVKRGCGVRLLRDDTVIHEGELSTLKRFKDEVPEVRAGTECGMAFVNYQDLQVGDQIECFEVQEIERKL